MGKHKIASAVSALALVAGAGVLGPVAFADGEVRVLESCEGIEDCAVVTSTAELSDAFTSHKSTVLMGGSFDLTADLRTGADMDLYLNNYTLTSDGWSIINVDGDLTIYAGENGKIVETGGTYAPLYVYNKTTMKSGTIEAAGQAVSAYYDTGLFTMDGGAINAGSNTATATIVNNGAKFVMNGGTINGDTWGVSVFKNAEFEMNGGSINISSNNGIGVAGNGSLSGNNEGTNAKLTLNAGTITSGDLGVYAPQVNGITTLGSDLTVNAGKCGVEVRAGTLNVNGATINVDANADYAFNPNGSGSTATGVAIAVAQHTTTQAITANVASGTFTAPVAFAEANPQGNEAEDIAKVSLAISGGTFNATNGDPIVASEDVTGFITGGTYNKELNADYIAEGYVAYPGSNKTVYNVLPVIPEAKGSDEATDEETAKEVADDNTEELGNIAGDVRGVLLDQFVNLTSEDEITFTSGAGAKFWVHGDGARDALLGGHMIVAELNSYEIDIDDLDNDDLALLNSWLEENMEVFGLIQYDIDLLGNDLSSVGTGIGYYIGGVTEIPVPLTLTYDVSGAPAVAEGKTRTWKVIRAHDDGNGEYDMDMIAAEYDEETGLISWQNDKFSVFVITYEDEEEVEAPNTGAATAEAGSATNTDGLLTAIVAMSVALIAMGAVRFAKRK